MVADQSARLVVSKTTMAVTHFGIFVVQEDEFERRLEIGTAKADIDDRGLGITLASGEFGNLRDSPDYPVYPVGSTAAVMRRGRCWALVEQEVKAGDPVWVRFTVDGNNKIVGALRKATATGATAKVDSARFASSSHIYRVKRYPDPEGTVAGITVQRYMVAMVDINLP